MIDIKKLEKAIEARHHYVAKFWDFNEANVEKEKNLDLLKRIKDDNTASQEDIEKAENLMFSFM